MQLLPDVRPADFTRSATVVAPASEIVLHGAPEPVL
jgi:hypothetical protein